MTNSYIRELGPKLIENGYRIVPVRPRAKAPAIADWVRADFTAEDARGFQAECGIGIKCGQGDVPVYAFDVDTAGEVELSAAFLRAIMAEFPQLKKSFRRVGAAPKCLIAFRMDRAGVPVKRSRIFSKAGHKLQLEVLGAGRQFVAYGIHEKTGKPYTYEIVDESDPAIVFSDVLDPTTIPAASLPLLPPDAAERAIALFESVMAGDARVVCVGETRTTVPVDSDTAYLMPSYPPLGLSAEDVRREFRDAKYDVDDRASWVRLLMMLKHEFQGREDEGLRLADELSSMATNGSYKGFEDVKATWDSLHKSDDPNAVTIRSLVRQAQERTSRGLFAKADEPSNEGIAAKVALEYSDRIRYCVESGGWLIFNGLYWCKEDAGDDPGEESEGVSHRTNILAFSREAIFPYVRNMADLWDKQHPEECAVNSDGSPKMNEKGAPKKDRNPWRKLYTRLSNTATAVRSIANECLSAYDALRIRMSVLDRYIPGQAIFPAANGLVDLRTGKLVRPDPDLYLSRHTDVPYDPAADCPVFKQALFDWMSGEEDRVRYMQNFLGYLAIGDPTLHILTIFLGEGGNGKSVLLRVLAKVFGSLHQVVPAATLVRKKKSLADASGSGAREDLMKLIGARVVTCSELDKDTRLRAAEVKAITGQDVITARGLYGKFVDFVPYWSVVLATNHMPQILEKSAAMRRRLRIVKFKETFDENHPRFDEHLWDKLEAEMPGILNFIVKGAMRVISEGPKKALMPPDSMRRDLAEFDDETDYLGGWIKRFLRPIKDTKEAPAALRSLKSFYLSWKSYAEELGIEDLYPYQAAFTRDLKSRKDLGLVTGWVHKVPHAKNYAIRAGDDGSPEVEDEDLADRYFDDLTESKA